MAFQLDSGNPKHAHTAERLRAAEILWLASVRPDGRPHLVPVWFLWEGETILIFSKPGAQKVRNLRQNPAVTVSLDETNQGDDVTVLEGVAEFIADADTAPALPIYTSKYAERLTEMRTTTEALLKEYSQAIRITIIRQADI